MDGTTLGAATITLALLTIATLCARKNRQPIKARSPTLMVFTAIGATLQIIDTLIHPRRCILHIWTFYLGHALLVMPYAFRAYRLLLIFNVNREKTNKHKTRQWHTLRRRMGEPWLLTRFTAVLAILLAACAAATVLAHYYHYDICPTTTTNNNNNYEAQLQAEAARFIQQIIILVAAHQIWHVIDAFHIRTELCLIAALWILANAIHVACGLASHTLWDDMQPWMPTCTAIGAFAISILWPIAVSFPCAARLTRGATHNNTKRTMMLLRAGTSSLASIDSVLKDPLCLLAFQEFMQKRFEVENVLFFIETELYADHPSHDQRLALARDIYQQYLAQGATLHVAHLELALTTDLRAKIHSGRAPQNLFQHAQRAVLRYLDREHFQDFLHSKTCASLMRTLRRNERLYGTLVDSDMISDDAGLVP